MKKLNLNPGILSVSREGHDFTFRADSAFAERVTELAGEAERRTAMAAAEGRHNEAEVTAFLSHAVDSLLGEGASDIIFGEDTPEILTLLDVLDVIMNAFREYRAARIAKLKEGIA